MYQRRAERENGGAYPELDKPILICESFHCVLDDLLKGDMKKNSGVSRDAYETHELTKTKEIIVGIGYILAGIHAYCSLKPFMDNEGMLLYF